MDKTDNVKTCKMYTERTTELKCYELEFLYYMGMLRYCN